MTIEELDTLMLNTSQAEEVPKSEPTWGLWNPVFNICLKLVNKFN